jgi:uncharacterized repeat protein (TIGR01451 family)
MFANNPQNQPLLVVPQFDFILDGQQTKKNDSLGMARFENVAPGVHSVTSPVPSTWTQVAVSPIGGIVTVIPGASCVQVVFQNKQVIEQNANLTVTKSDGRTTIMPNEVATYTITITNTTSTIANNVVAIDSVPSGLTFVSVSDGGVWNNQTVTWQGLTIMPNSSRTISFQARVQNLANGTVLRNTVQVTGPNTVTAEDTTIVQANNPGQCPLDIDIRAEEDTVEPDDDLRYVIRVRNTSSINRTVDVVQALDDLTEFDDASDDGEDDGDAVVWEDILVRANDSVTLTSDVIVTDDAEDGDEILSLAFADCAVDEDVVDVETDDEDDDDDDDGNAAIEITKDASQSEVFPGGMIEYTITVENTGDETLEDVEIVDETSNAGMLTLIDDDDADGALGLLAWTIDELEEGDTQTFRYRVVVGTDAPIGTVIRNTATVDTDGEEDEAEATVTVIGSLPQTGFGTIGNGGSAFLRPYAGAAGTALPLTALLSVAATGIGAGLRIGRKFFL